MKFFGMAMGVVVIFARCATPDMTTARNVSVKPGKGGVLTLNPPQDPKARAKAEALMTQTCSGKRAEVTEEGDVTVGTTTSSNTEHKAGSESGIKVAGFALGGSNPSSNSESTQKQLTEWRITYECK